MNNTFNLNRFLLLFKKHAVEHAKTYLLSTAVLAGILTMVLGFICYGNEGRLDIGAQADIFIFLFLASGSIFTSLCFADLGNKKKATPLLTLPASHLEKYLVTWIYSFIIFQLVFVGLFYLVDGIIISLSTPESYDYPTLTSNNKLFSLFAFNNGEEPFIAFIIYTLFHALTIWGALFFEKLHFVKTCFVFFVFMILLILINVPLLHLIIGIKTLNDMPFTSLSFNETDGHHLTLLKNINASAGMYIIGMVILAIVVVLIWVSAFFRLKEKEI